MLMEKAFEMWTWRVAEEIRGEVDMHELKRAACSNFRIHTVICHLGRGTAWEMQ